MAIHYFGTFNVGCNEMPFNDTPGNFHKKTGGVCTLQTISLALQST